MSEEGINAEVAVDGAGIAGRLSIQPKAENYAKVEAAETAPAPLDLDADLARLSDWFAGEWDDLRTSPAQQDPPAPGSTPHGAHPRLFLPVAVPAIGGCVFRPANLG